MSSHMKSSLFSRNSEVSTVIAIKTLRMMLSINNNTMKVLNIRLNIFSVSVAGIKNALEQVAY